MTDLNIFISGLYEARQNVVAGAFTHAISLVDPDQNMGEFIGAHTAGNVNHLLLRFKDVEESDRTELPAHLFPDRNDIRTILKFTENLSATDLLLVHCHAGISRSPAVAAGVLCQHGTTPTDTINKILRLRPHAFPNLLLTTLFDNELGLNGTLIEAVKKFRGDYAFAGALIK
jgi:predicted protein tyrosine phosphatase